ncbi:MAG: hypothetical protein GPOALKHO_000383 [Sodalis sp.]|nr:MAG: hypothetical protein GPOALKHO_000383 [Sodalis sp.]
MWVVMMRCIRGWHYLFRYLTFLKCQIVGKGVASVDCRKQIVPHARRGTV